MSQRLYHVNNMPDDERHVEPHFEHRCHQFLNDVVMKDIKEGKLIYRSVYIGTAGIGLLNYRMYEVNKKSQNPTPNTALTEALTNVAYDTNVKSGRSGTFLEGIAGNLALQIVIMKGLDRKQGLEAPLRKLQELCVVLDQMPKDECELLYGRAGYLYALAFVRKYADLPDFADFEMNKTLQAIVTSGIRNGNTKCPLRYLWHDSEYLGGAHGYAGILLMLLEFRDYFEIVEEKLDLKEGDVLKAIKRTIDFLLDECMFPGGNIRSSIGSKSDRLVHWCHGAPGFIPLMIQCLECFPDDHKRYQNILLQFGEVVWMRGLLSTKGLGLCHGIGGNGMCLLLVYRATKDTKWLNRAKQFAKYGMGVYQTQFQFADRPTSLFEGCAGFGYFLNELIGAQQQPFFAGSEI